MYVIAYVIGAQKIIHYILKNKLNMAHKISAILFVDALKASTHMASVSFSTQII